VINVLIIGASRGLGLEFATQYRDAGAEVTATARDDAALERLRALGAAALRLDIADAASASTLAASIAGSAFDVAIVNAGVYGPRTSGLAAPSQAEFDHVMHTNVLGAMRVLPQLAGAMVPGAKLAVISSRMGSMALRRSADGWLYRASKAALNSVLTDAALTLAGGVTCVALHPGWVRTDMGGAAASLSASDSVSHMRRTLAALTPADNGRFLDHDGTALAW
jgi:NAD(P)-dependent dehydrogenase (short-subunit alcohol dehydrogenase family)